MDLTLTCKIFLMWQLDQMHLADPPQAAHPEFP
jgi:hypothetical protein